MGTLSNSEDPDEMQHNAAFHQDLHCLLSLKQPSGTDIHHNFKTSTCHPLKYKIGNSIIIYHYVWKNPSDYKGFILQ